MRIVTKRELEIFQLLADGCSTAEISIQLNISKKTVRNHISNVIQKLSEMTGRNVSSEQENKIISAVINDKVPSNIDKLF